MPRKLGFIGGLGLQDLFPGLPSEIDTPYGRVNVVYTRTEPRIVYIPRFGFKLDTPPYEVNYRALISALNQLGVKFVVATVFGVKLNPDLNVLDVVVPSDLIDLSSISVSLTRLPLSPLDPRVVFSNDLRKLVSSFAVDLGLNVRDGGVVCVTDGSRFETPAESRFYRLIGCDVLATSIAPEAFLAKEIGLEYVALVLVTFEAADSGCRRGINELIDGIQKTVVKIKELALRIAHEIEKAS